MENDLMTILKMIDLNLFKKYTTHLWFALSVCITILGAFLYFWYTVPQYKATTLLVKDEKRVDAF
jgi:uncharacterized protein involved in exopolysaccharide biosynthesis